MEGSSSSVAALAGQALAERGEGAAPGVAALLDGVREDRSHSVLDLSQAVDRNLRLYARFARWVRFADLLGEEGWARSGGSAAALAQALPEQPDHAYDLVLAWDVIDRLFPEDRLRLVRRLAEVSAPRARLHLVVRSEEAVSRALRFTLLDTNRIRYEPLPTPAVPRPRLLPADVTKALAPFHVLHAYTLRSGMREYVATRE